VISFSDARRDAATGIDGFKQPAGIKRCRLLLLLLLLPARHSTE
jgi:hypothetical protein